MEENKYANNYAQTAHINERNTCQKITRGMFLESEQRSFTTIVFYTVGSNAVGALIRPI
jgi:hypothetical protein